MYPSLPAVMTSRAAYGRPTKRRRCLALIISGLLAAATYGATGVAADVIDFKTDAVGDDESAIEAAVETYRPQVEAYRRAVSSLFDIKPERISGRLVFVGAGVVVLVSGAEGSSR